MENKELITQKLFELLKLTRDSDIYESMEYHEDEYGETVEIRYSGGMGGHIVDVTADSGTALIRDVLRGM